MEPSSKPQGGIGWERSKIVVCLTIIGKQKTMSASSNLRFAFARQHTLRTLRTLERLKYQKYLWARVASFLKYLWARVASFSCLSVCFSSSSYVSYRQESADSLVALTTATKSQSLLFTKKLLGFLILDTHLSIFVGLRRLPEKCAFMTLRCSHFDWRG